MIHFKPTVPQLTDSLDHIAYEVEQVIGICAWLIQRLTGSPALGESPESILEMNVYLESFLLHIRVLCDFFEKAARTRRNGVELDDVLAGDYGFTTAPINLGQALRQRINVEVAHLSYSRAASGAGARGWQPEAMARPLLSRCREFAVHILAVEHVALDGERRARYTGLCTMIDGLLA